MLKVVWHVGGFILCLIIIELPKARTHEHSVDNMVNAMEPFGVNCDPKPERKHFEELALRVENPQRTTKCLQHCLMHLFGMISDNKTELNENKLMEMFRLAYSDRDDELKQVIQNCNAENASIQDKCENAQAHSNCLYKGLSEHGFDMPEVKRD